MTILTNTPFFLKPITLELTVSFYTVVEEWMVAAQM